MKNTAKPRVRKTVHENVSGNLSQDHQAIQLDILNGDSRKNSLVGVVQLLPRVIRVKDAPAYLGMDRNRFNRDVRPSLTPIRIGIQGIAFDRLELDAWFDEYKLRAGQPGRRCRASEKPSPVKTSRVSARRTHSPPSTGGEFAKALAQLDATKRKRAERP